MHTNNESPELAKIRETLLRELCFLQENIEENLGQIKSEVIKDTLLKIIERQDKLFAYYIDSREASVTAMAVSHKSNKNAYTESLDLLAKLYG